MQALVGAEPPSDDIALLVLRRQPVADTDADTLELELPAAPSSLKPLRIAMRRWLAHIRADRQATADLLTAVGEACANAIEHAYGPAGGTVSVRLALPGTRRDRRDRRHRPVAGGPRAASAAAASPSCVPSATRSRSTAPTPAPGYGSAGRSQKGGRGDRRDA